VQWDAMALDDHIDEVETTVEVQFNGFVVFLLLSWSESDWDFDLLFTWHQNLAWHQWEV
jgi:hypothetical protein